MRNGQLAKLTIKLISAPEVPPRDLTFIEGQNPYAGAEVANLSPALAEEISVDSDLSGVIVIRLKRGSPADRIGLEPGDILLRLNGEAIGSVATLREFVRRNYSAWQVEIRRGGRVLQIVVQG